jgi:signal transduction histidine kinase
VKSSSWTSIWLSPRALSNTALLWATVIGAFGTLVLVPGPTSTGLFTWQWVGVVAASQCAFALVIVVMRATSPRPGPWVVLSTLALAGAVRGLVIAIGAGLIGVVQFSVALIASRALNSAVISVIGVALIGATLTWRADFRAQYRVLRDRALLVGGAAHDGDTIDPSVLDAWTTMKVDLDTSLSVASELMATGSSRETLDEVAAILTSAIEVNLRPAARAMWREAIPPEEPLRLRALLVDTLSAWRLPLATILGFLAVVVGVGSVVRSGVLDGGAYTLRYLLVTGLILWASTSLARLRRQWAPTIAMLTLLVLPPAILLSDHFIGDALLGLPQDPTGQIVVALQTPVTTILIAMAVQAARERQQVLAALQARIDADAAVLRQRDNQTARDSQRLSLFVHHSVQSELAALAMQIREAASTRDPATMEAVRLSALAHLERLQSLDQLSAPWARPTGGRARIDQITEAWTGILDVRVDLPDERECRADQWYVAAQVIEEGLANSARHGGAGRVAITGACDRGELVIHVTDDGVAVAHAQRAEPGLGTQWLDRVAPGQWALEQLDGGARLSVRIS